MIATLERLIADVRTEMGENRHFDDLLAARDTATLTLGQLIAHHAPGQAALLIAEAPHSELEPSGELPADSLVRADGWGELPLPDDFLRLHSLRLADWPRAVTAPTDADDAMALLARCCKGRPVVADSFTPIAVASTRFDGRRLEFFCDSPASVPLAEALYCRRPSFDRDGGLEISARLYRPLVARLAALCSGQQ